jgi:hypothetical protein
MEFALPPQPRAGMSIDHFDSVVAECGDEQVPRGQIDSEMVNPSPDTWQFNGANQREGLSRRQRSRRSTI